MNITDFDCEDVGNQTVTLTVSDESGNQNTCTATVTVEDNEAPEALCQDLTVTLDVETGDVSISPEDVDNGSNDACGVATLSLDDNTFTCADLGDNTVTLTVTDVNENASTCTATITWESYAFDVSVPACQTVYFGYEPAACATINSTVSGGNAPFTYLWGTGETTADIEFCASSPDSPEPFTLVVTDANGCTASADPAASVEVVDIRCGNNLNKVAICHNGDNTLCVSPNAVPAHLAHGDYLGECDAPDPCGGSQALIVNPGNTSDHFEQGLEPLSEVHFEGNQ
ncbi:MAG: HYR domain-containing protein, partial [Planctomycetota bacterium]